jgi:SAM-dependent methyltransferase
VTAFVSPDGSPLAIYLALPAGEVPLLIHGANRPDATILDLGSGPGRLARPLHGLGHRVVAVDDSPEMLAHVTGAEVVCGDAFTIDLRRRFDTVLAASHLINQPGSAARRALLGTARRHLVDAGGVVLVQRFAPGWILESGPTESKAGPVLVSFEPNDRDGDRVTASVTYRLADQTWVQRFEAEDVDDTKLAADAEAAGLQVVDLLSPDGTWVRLTAS